MVMKFCIYIYFFNILLIKHFKCQMSGMRNMKTETPSMSESENHKWVKLKRYKEARRTLV